MADEIIRELWRIKDEIAREYDYDLDALVAHRRDALEILRLLARGEKEIEAGEGRDLDAVFAEVDALLAQWQQDD